MLSRVVSAVAAPFRSIVRGPRRRGVYAVARRLVHFWFVWSALLLVHETGHAVGAWRQGLEVRRVTAGLGPVVWRGNHGSTELVLRLVPLAGITTLGPSSGVSGVRGRTADADWRTWGRELTTIAGGICATLLVTVGMACGVAMRERSSGRTWRWGRFVVADALVLTLFNFLPVPPLDGGRVVIGALAAWRGAHLSGDAMFWLQVSGLALAVIPMTLWTRWTAGIDRFTLRWGAPALGAAGAD